MSQTGTVRRFGPNEVEVLIDGIFDVPRGVLRHGGGDAALARLLEGVRDEDLRIPVNAFLLRGPEGVSLIDAGCGTAWGEAFGRLRDLLRERGMGPEAVDRVILTHVHSDHALGLLEGEGAYFPRAEVWVPAVDWQHFRDPAAREAAPDGKRGAFDIAAQVGRAYGDRVREIGAGEVLPGVTLVPMPGHSPGHSGYRLEGPEGVLLILGDTLHFAGLQGRDPAVRTEWDFDGDAAERTRREVLRQVRENGWLVVGGHVAGLDSP
ncbi:MBL fold metallo-hydrolase [Roseomonas elaeocarpi]|uniref:MBL fold metallo-hydrolase n=1 Tax=Roseomonas elaeocarpi TaxID=907779 RepID=A0ABV6JTJ9_9PROT